MDFCKVMSINWKYGGSESSLTLLWDLLPGVGWVHEGGVLDLVVDVLVFVEGERPAQTDVDDDADWPHVQRSVVAFAAKHLWSQICWRADDWATERLLTDDTSEAEVAEFHLEDERGECWSPIKHLKLQKEKTVTHELLSPEGRVLLRPGGRSQASDHSAQCSWSEDVWGPPGSTDTTCTCWIKPWQLTVDGLSLFRLQILLIVSVPGLTDLRDQELGEAFGQSTPLAR